MEIWQNIKHHADSVLDMEIWDTSYGIQKERIWYMKYTIYARVDAPYFDDSHSIATHINIAM